MSAPPPDDCLPGTACPTCFNMFGAPNTPHAPMKTQCGHLVCGECAGAAVALEFRNCSVCKLTTGGAKYTESLGFARFATKEHARLHQYNAVAAVLCVECVAIKKQAELEGEESDEPSIAAFTCQGCRGKDRALCGIHSQSHAKHASLKQLGGFSAPAAATHCVDHLGTPLTRMCITCNVAVCADCCLAGAHPATTHDVALLSVACERLAAKVAELAPVLRAGAAGLAADSDEVLRAKADMLREFEGSVAAVKAEVGARIAQLLAAQDAWIAQGRAIADARVKVLDDQATALNVSAAQVSAGVSMLESVLGDAAARADPLTLATALDSGSSLARLIGQRGGPSVSTTLLLLCDMAPLEAALAGVWHLRQERVDAGRCEVVGPGLTGFIVGDATEAAVTAQNYVDITLKDDAGAIVTAVRAEEVVVSLTTDAAGGAGGDGAPACVDTVVCNVRGEGVIRAGWVMSRDVDAALLAVSVRGGEHVRGSPFRLSNVTPKSFLLFPDSVILAQVPPAILQAFLQALGTRLPHATGFRLLYRSSLDGPTPKAFHGKCDNQGPTVTFVRSTSGHSFGAYTEVAWQSTGGWVSTSEAFLFSIVNPHGDPPTLFPLKAKPSAGGAGIYHDAGYGFLFSDDLNIGRSSGNANKVFDATGSYTNFPNVYQDVSGRNRGVTTFTDVTNTNHYTPEEVEVWALV